MIRMFLIFALMAPLQAPPQMTLKDIEGRTLRLSDYRGKVVLLNFWATWCAPCRAEMPDLIKWQREYRARGLQIIGITYPPEVPAEVREVVRNLKINYPVVIGDEEMKERFDSSDVLPITVVIDRKGAVREVIRGILFAEEFDEKIKTLLDPGEEKPRNTRKGRHGIHGRKPDRFFP